MRTSHSSMLLLQVLTAHIFISCLLALTIYVLTQNLTYSLSILLGSSVALLGNTLSLLYTLRPITPGFEQMFVKMFIRVHMGKLLLCALLIASMIVWLGTDPVFTAGGFILVQLLSWLLLFARKHRRRIHFN